MARVYAGGTTATRRRHPRTARCLTRSHASWQDDGMSDRSIDGSRSPSDRRGELLAFARAAADSRRPVDLLAQWATDATVRPAQLDQRTSTAYDSLALEAAADYEALLLSPVAPIGTSSAVAPTSQDRTLSTIRGTEVVSDPTNVLALECARRLRVAPARPRATVHGAPGGADAAGAQRTGIHAALPSVLASPIPAPVSPTTASRSPLSSHSSGCTAGFSRPLRACTDSCGIARSRSSAAMIAFR